MLTKFESKSARVKGLSFHPKRPWILSSLHNGSVQIWDYRMGTLVDTFSDHEGPVRACAFHPTQPIFVTCGDDNKVRVFNYQQRKCLFTLTGHQDYIRSVCFHHEAPWLMTASDDQTIRIWNWQSRSCIAQLTGHSHYVMCAQFHPKDDLVVSASLDQSIRVWNIGHLRRKGSMTPVEDVSSPRRGSIDLFASESQVKFILEGHDRGVNWVQFHPTKPMIVSGSDDRSVKLWRYNDSRAWETDTFRGHFNNVSCVIFHPTLDLIISNSEDKTLRIWDFSKRGAQAQVFRRDNDRYWTLAGHPSTPLFAAGHDSGMILFKLERERPPMVVVDDNLFYVKGANILRRDLNKLSATETAVGVLSQAPVLPASFDYSSADKALLVSSAGEYEIVSRAAKKGHGSHGHFLSQQRFVVFDATAQQIHIKSLADNSTISSLACPIPSVEHIFPASNDCILVVSHTQVVLYNPAENLVLADLPVANVKRICWSPDRSKCALMARKVITVIDSSFTLVSSSSELVSIKSGVWDANGLFFYSTPHHLKYLLPTGETGIICTLENVLYLARVRNDLVQALDRQGNLVNLKIDPAEFIFKLALIQHDLSKVMHIINTSNLVGQSVISYLRQHGYSAVALQFVDDPMARFELALESGDFDVAMESAEILDRKEVWDALSEEAIKLGHFATAKIASRKAGKPARVSFLSAVTGSVADLRQSLEEATLNGDLSARLQSAMLLNDSLDLARSLEEMGLHSLAFLAYRQAGVDALTPPSGANLPPLAEKLIPVTPISVPCDNWPLTKPLCEISIPAGISRKTTTTIASADKPGKKSPRDSSSAAFTNVGDGGWEDDFKMPSPPAAAVAGGDEEEEFQEFSTSPEPINPLLQTDIPILHIFGNSLSTAKELLRAQAGVIDFKPLDSLFVEATQIQSFGALMNRFEDIQPFITFADIQERFNNGLASTTAGKFSEAIHHFESAIHSCLLAILEPGESVDDLIAEAREYILGLRMELKRKELLASVGGGEPSGDIAKRVLELSCYFTNCRIRPEHLMLALRSSMNLSFKLKDYSLSARMARRLIDLNPGEPALSQAQKVAMAASKMAAASADSGLVIDYDDLVDFTIDAGKFKPIYSGMPIAQCPLCQASYDPTQEGSVCHICLVAGIGLKTSGLSLYLSE